MNVFFVQFLSPHLTSSSLGPIFPSTLPSVSLVLKVTHKCVHVIRVTLFTFNKDTLD